MPPPPSMAREESYGSAVPPPPPPPPPPMMGMGMGGRQQMDNDAPPPLPTGRSPAAMAMMAAGRAVRVEAILGQGWARDEWADLCGFSSFVLRRELAQMLRSDLVRLPHLLHLR